MDLYTENPALLENSEDPDQIPQKAAFHQCRQFCINKNSLQGLKYTLVWKSNLLPLEMCWSIWFLTLNCSDWLTA